MRSGRLGRLVGRSAILAALGIAGLGLATQHVTSDGDMILADWTWESVSVEPTPAPGPAGEPTAGSEIANVSIMDWTWE